MLSWELMGFFRATVSLSVCSRWVTKVEDIMMKMVPRPLPSLISLVILWLFYLSLLFWLKFERPTYNVLRYKSYGTYKSLVMKFSHLVFGKVDVIFLQECRNYNWQWLTSQQPTFYHHFFFFCRTLNFIWLFVQHLLSQEPFTWIKVGPNAL